MATILYGAQVAHQIKHQLKEKIKDLETKPCLAIIQIGNNASSSIYIKNKKAFGESVGAQVIHIHLDETVTETQVSTEINKLNNDASVHGIIMQLPIPDNLNKESLLRQVDVVKDVDGLSDKPMYTPATARGIMSLLYGYSIQVKGRNVVMIGRSRLVGAPTSECLRSVGAEVHVCHKETKDIPVMTRKADIIIVAAGYPNLITKDYVKPGQVIIDVGINSITGEGDVVSQTVGDVNFKEVSQIVEAISPVPGGVGPLTVASLFENLFDAFQYSTQKK